MKKRWRTRDCLFIDEDAVALTVALRSRFPQLRIVVDDSYERRPEDTPERVRSLVVPYCDTLSGPTPPRASKQIGWLEPEGWEPEWAPFERVYRIENQPRVQFRWLSSCFTFGSWTGVNGYFCLNLGRVTAHVLEGDKEHMSFVNAAWRTIASVSTNKTYWCRHNPANGEILGPYNPNAIWIGYKALEWVRSDPRRCLFHRHRPVDAIEGYADAQGLDAEHRDDASRQSAGPSMSDKDSEGH